MSFLVIQHPVTLRITYSRQLPLLLTIVLFQPITDHVFTKVPWFLCPIHVLMHNIWVQELRKQVPQNYMI